MTVQTERRRYFRIDDTVSMRICSQTEASMAAKNGSGFVAEHDKELEKLIAELVGRDPTAAKIAQLLNQKIERLANIQSVETRLVSQVAMRVQEVNISACGMAFHHDEPLVEGSQITIELELRPSEQTLTSDAIVVGCEAVQGEPKQHYCRVDFYGMSPLDQEFLIQQIVQAQSAQLKSRRN